MLLRIPDPRLENLLGFLNELAMQINGVGGNSAIRVVLAEDEVGGLLVVSVHHLSMVLALLRKLMCCRAIASRVCLVGLRNLINLTAIFKGDTNLVHTSRLLIMFLPCQIP